MKITCHQPYLFPHLGVFSKWQNADLMVWLDKTQYVKGHYSNRCKLGDGKWAIIPVKKAPLNTSFDEIEIHPSWHLTRLMDRIDQDYRDAFFTTAVLGSLYIHFNRWENLHSNSLSKLNITLLRWAGRILNIPVTNLSQTEILQDTIGADERLIAICKHFHADTYLSGPQGPKYMDREKWDAAGIKVEVCQWKPAEYDRETRPWVPYMSVLDALCCEGPGTKDLLEAKVQLWI